MDDCAAVVRLGAEGQPRAARSEGSSAAGEEHVVAARGEDGDEGDVCLNAAAVRAEDKDCATWFFGGVGELGLVEITGELEG